MTSADERIARHEAKLAAALDWIEKLVEEHTRLRARWRGYPEIDRFEEAAGDVPKKSRMCM